MSLTPDELRYRISESGQYTRLTPNETVALADKMERLEKFESAYNRDWIELQTKLERLQKETRCFYCCSCAQSMCLHSRERCVYCSEREDGGPNPRVESATYREVLIEAERALVISRCDGDIAIAALARIRALKLEE